MGSWSQHAIAASGNIACIGGNTSEGYKIHVFDVTSTSAPVLKAALPTPGNAIRLWLTGTTLFVSSNTINFNVMEAYDLTDPAEPEPAGRLQTTLQSQDITVLAGDGEDPAFFWPNRAAVSIPMALTLLQVPSIPVRSVHRPTLHR